MYMGEQSPVKKTPNRHLVIFLLSVSFVLVQCILELIFISLFINAIPELGTFLYAHMWIPSVIHIVCTVILLWYAGIYGDRYCARSSSSRI